MIELTATRVIFPFSGLLQREQIRLRPVIINKVGVLNYSRLHLQSIRVTNYPPWTGRLIPSPYFSANGRCL
jgi:hypothetical protein